MVDKLREYQGFTGRMHTLRDMAKEKLDTWKEEHPEGVKGIAMNVIKTDPHSRGPPKPARSLDDYPHIYRRKTRMELIRVSAAVMGIEFSYAAETAFVSPALLKIGVAHQHMTLVWGLSPLIGFFLTPVLGSLSDGCRLIMGRRRPFILILALGVFIGLILVPNGKDIGHALGDFYPSEDLENYSDIYSARNLLQFKNENDLNENINFSESEKSSDFFKMKKFLGSENFNDCYLNFRIPEDFSSTNGNENLGQTVDLDNLNENSTVLKWNVLYEIKKSSKSKISPGSINSDDVNKISIHLKPNGLEQSSKSKNFSECYSEFLKSTNFSDVNAVQNFLESSFRDCYLNFSNSKHFSDLDRMEDFLESKNFNNCYFNSLESKNIGELYGKITLNETDPNKNSFAPELSDAQYSHPWGVVFTVLGTVLLDFDADSCQSPARAYLLDVTLPEDHAKGLSTFTIMAGLGGFFGYALGGTNWDATAIGAALGGHVRAVFTLITVLFVICVLYTVTSFKEVPLDLLETEKEEHNLRLKIAIGDAETIKIAPDTEQSYGSLNKDPPLQNDQIIEIAVIEQNIIKTNGNSPADNQLSNGPMEANKLESQSHEHPTLKEYLLSIIFMPHSLRMLCLTNLFCWMAHVCYSLYFTDFVGEAVFNGDPKAPPLSEAHELYEEGIRFGCWGMAMYSLSCSCYSLIIESLIKRFKARNVYIGGLLFYSLGMLLMALTQDKIGVILFSWTAGVMYSTLFTMPYLLVAHYHANGVFGLTKDGEVKLETRLRGLGTDVAIVSSMVFLAQFLLSICMGSIVEWAGTTTAVVSVASFLAFCGAVSATKVMYLDL